jgi:nitroreductase
MNVIEVIEKRKSIRDYLDEEVDKEDLKIIVEAGRKAPQTGPFHITVVTNKELLKQISDSGLEGMKNSGEDLFVEKSGIPGFNPTYNAPSLIIFSAPDENPFGKLTTSVVAENVILMATDLGYGTCYLISPVFAFKTSKKDELFKSLQIPTGFNPICMVSIGKEGKYTEGEPKEEVDNVNYVE